MLTTTYNQYTQDSHLGDMKRLHLLLLSLLGITDEADYM